MTLSRIRSYHLKWRVADDQRRKVGTSIVHQAFESLVTNKYKKGKTFRAQQQYNSGLL